MCILMCNSIKCSNLGCANSCRNIAATISICWNVFKNIRSNKTCPTIVLLRWSLLWVFFATANLYTFGHTLTKACAIWLQYFSGKANTLSSITLLEFWMLPEEWSWLWSGLWKETPLLRSLGNTPELDVYMYTCICYEGQHLPCVTRFLVVEATPLLRSPGNYKNSVSQGRDRFLSNLYL